MIRTTPEQKDAISLTFDTQKDCLEKVKELCRILRGTIRDNELFYTKYNVMENYQIIVNDLLKMYPNELRNEHPDQLEEDVAGCSGDDEQEYYLEMYIKKST